jgi:phage FluMu gp28-like protein
MPQRTKAKAPREMLLSYQDDIAYDAARFVYALMARQTGKDFSFNHSIVLDCLRHAKAKTKTDWMIAAPSERQSIESLGKSKDWSEVFKLAVADYEEEREGGSETLLKSATITFPHGSRIIAVPGKPDTVRGFSANVFLTEFAFFEQPDLTWRAIIPSITNPLRGGEKKVRIGTTPNGIGNKAHDLWVKNWQVPDAKWSCHRVDIYDAVRQGLPVNPEELREALDDPDGWSQEYLLEFMDAASVLLPYELIATCESPEANEVCSPEFWRNAQCPIDMGIDFGRKKDLTVSVAGAALGDVSQVIEVLCLEKMPTPQQVEILTPRIIKARRVALDYTGPGVGLGDYLVQRFGEWNPEKHLYGKIELVTFSNLVKVDLFSKLRMAFERKLIRVPISRIFREDLHSMSRVSTPGGSVTYKAPHTPDGHADRCTGLALMWHARSDNGVPFAFARLNRRLRMGLRTTKGCLT